MEDKKFLNIHLVSDSTGETLKSLSRAVMSQFENVEVKEFVWPLIRAKEQLNKIEKEITENKGIVMYTILQDELIESLKKVCYELDIPCIAVLSPFITAFSNYLGMHVSNVVGRQHLLDQNYFSKVDAINYTMNHDDGQSSWDLYDADIVIIGVSRTSKSPTSIYLSCRGYKTANVPFVSFDTVPDSIFELKKPLIVGLTINPEKLVHIRKSRMNSLGHDLSTSYIDIEHIEKEILESRKLFSKLNCPIIDVTKKSVEETSACIIQLFQERQNKSKP